LYDHIEILNSFMNWLM